MVTDHKNAIALFEQASKSSDAAVSAFAAKTLPALRDHLRMAQDAVAAGKGGSATLSETASPKPPPPAR